MTLKEEALFQELTNQVPWVNQLTAPGFLWDLKSLKETLMSPNTHIWHFDNAQPPSHGFILWRALSPEVEILALATHPNYQGQGLMASGLKVWSEHLCQQGIESIFLEVHALNSHAIKLYTHLGFIKVGHRPKYYSDGQGADIYRLRLGS